MGQSANVISAPTSSVIDPSTNLDHSRADGSRTEGSRADGSRSKAAKSMAREMQLGEDSGWKKLLFYRSRWLRSDTSVIDGDKYFLAKDGGHRPEGELTASIDAFYGDALREGRHPICIWPARYKWLSDKLASRLSDWPTRSCPGLDAWKAQHRPTAISLVFAANHGNNPASMFGHTFFRLHRAKPGSTPSAYLDYAINFAANPYTDVPFVYHMLGLAGGFPGTFSLLPYYVKLQEYNNAESRDLWEYQIDMSPEDIEQFLNVIAEVGPHPVDYFYVDENCALILLMTLEAVLPQHDIADRLSFIAIPSDTIKAAGETPGLVAETNYRPANLNRYRIRWSYLDAQEKDLIRAILRDNKVLRGGAFSSRAADSKARIIDALFEYIEYKEKLAGAKQPEVFGEVLREATSVRAGLRATPADLRPLDRISDPIRGHKTMFLGAGYQAASNDRTRLTVLWTPTLHDLISPSLGYTNDLQIKMIELKASIPVDEEQNAPSWEEWHESWTDNKPRLEHFTFISSKSVGAVEGLLWPIPWKFQVQSRRDYGISGGRWDDSDHCLRHEMIGGGGVALGTVDQFLVAYGMPILSLGAWCNAFKTPYIAGGGEVGVYWQPLYWMKLSLVSWRQRVFAKSTALDEYNSHLSLAVQPNEDWEIRLLGTRTAIGTKVEVLIGTYF